MFVGTDEYKNALLYGEHFFKRKLYNQAKSWLNVAKDYNEYRNRAIYYLTLIDIKQGNYARARLALNSTNLAANYKNILLIKLNTLEYNFETVRNNCEENLNYSEDQLSALLNMASSYKQTGEYNISELMIKTVINSSSKYEFVKLDLVRLYMMKHDFYTAEKILNSIDTKKLFNSQIEAYQTLAVHIKYYLGLLNNKNNIYNIDSEYGKYRLFDQSDEVLMQHIAKHFKQDENYDSYFLKYLDIKKVLEQIKDTITSTNSIRELNCDRYNIRLDSPIGFNGIEATNDISVVTVPEGNIILTMYPIRLSDEKKKKKLATDKTLMRKRILGGIK